jgi:hypothetical protein
MFLPVGLHIYGSKLLNQRQGKMKQGNILSNTLQITQI